MTSEAVTVADGSLYAGVAAPSGGASTGVVMLPQIGAAGLCGWLRFAERIVDRGAALVAVDPCGYGGSTCAGDVPIAHQVDAAAELLRGEHGVERVVLVGASMGGSQTVRAEAQGATIDAWVDLSGPSAWEGESLLDLVERVRHPGLVVYARRDGRLEYERARLLARRTGARFLGVAGGHGWDLVLTSAGRTTRVGAEVLGFVCPTPDCAGP
jgi:pimeloyl-ACP methyl ester carboxylesterase